MAFAKSIAGQFPTLGSPNFAGPPATTLAGGGNCATAQAIGVVVNATTTTVTFNALGGPGFVSRGWVRVKTTSVNGATTITWKVTATDGVTTQQLIPPTPVTAAGTNIDNMLPFMSDLNLTSVIVSLTSGTNTATYDVEVALNT